MDDIVCKVDTFEQMVTTPRQIFDCSRKSGLRLTYHICELGMTSISFLGKAITLKELTPEAKEIDKFLNTMIFPATKRQAK